MSGECFICDHGTSDVLVVERLDGTSYDASMCVVCLTETTMLSGPIHLAHELIDARKGHRSRHRGIAA